MKKNVVQFNLKNGVKAAGVNAKTLVSALIGASTSKGYQAQIDKITSITNLNAEQKPDLISDLSIKKFNDLPLYKFIIRNYPEFIVSTLPIYLCKTINGVVDELELLEIIHEQAEAGVNMFTIHPTANSEIIRMSQSRMMPLTSRGGGIVVKDLVQRGFSGDNAYLKIIDEIIKVACNHKIVISIGASFRSANIFDSYDETQIQEFKMQKEIADYVFAKGVGVIIEGPGHSTPQKLKLISKEYSKMGYPIMPLGPIPTDIAIGQDHISSSIGAVLLGILDTADIITAVTREEHTGGVPSTSSTIEAIISSKIAAHIIDLNKIGDISKDFEVANYRAKHQTCIYGKKNSGCSRCLEVCPLKSQLTLE